MNALEEEFPARFPTIEETILLANGLTRLQLDPNIGAKEKIVFKAGYAAARQEHSQQ